MKALINYLLQFGHFNPISSNFSAVIIVKITTQLDFYSLKSSDFKEFTNNDNSCSTPKIANMFKRI